MKNPIAIILTINIFTKDTWNRWDDLKYFVTFVH